MYNHYIPQSDGTYRRNYVPEATTRRQPPRHPVTQNTEPPPKKEFSASEAKSTYPSNPAPQTCSAGSKTSSEHTSPFSLLKSLLPKDVDSYDLIIIALLLLLCGASGEDDLAPILTVALYFLL